MLSCLRVYNVGTLKGIDLYPSFSFIIFKAKVVLIQIYFILSVFKVPQETGYLHEFANELFIC